jgi:hypothetical protein
MPIFLEYAGPIFMVFLTYRRFNLSEYALITEPKSSVLLSSTMIVSQEKSASSNDRSRLLVLSNRLYAGITKVTGKMVFSLIPPVTV